LIIVSRCYARVAMQGFRDLPVQQATQFEFVINLKVAKQIGVAILREVTRRYQD
jgi:ABC-type uncharacterized transport system substrate-binding protein